MDEPLAMLPDRIEFELREVRIVLSALYDSVVAVPRDYRGRSSLLGAVRLLTATLWPELGDLLDEG